MPGFLLIIIGIDAPVYGQEQASREGPFGQHVHEPAEGGSLLEEQEEWGIAQGGEQTATVGHDGDEEHDGVGLVLALADGLQEQADEEHGGACGAHEGGKHPTEGHDEGVGGGGGLHVALDADASRGCEQGHEEEDEGDVVVNHLVFQLVRHPMQAEPYTHRDAQQ